MNNGSVGSTGGSSTIYVEYGATYKGAGTTNVSIVTQNGGKVLFGNCPGVATFGSLVVGAGGISNLEWEINDAGPSATYPECSRRGRADGRTAANRVSGWSMGLVASQTPRIGGSDLWQPDLDGDAVQPVQPGPGDLARSIDADGHESGRSDGGLRPDAVVHLADHHLSGHLQRADQ